MSNISGAAVSRGRGNLPVFKLSTLRRKGNLGDRTRHGRWCVTGWCENIFKKILSSFFNIAFLYSCTTLFRWFTDGGPTQRNCSWAKGLFQADRKTKQTEQKQLPTQKVQSKKDILQQRLLNQAPVLSAQRRKLWPCRITRSGQQHLGKLQRPHESTYLFQRSHSRNIKARFCSLFSLLVGCTGAGVFSWYRFVNSAELNWHQLKFPVKP